VLSLSKLQEIKKLHQKKFRDECQLFFVEGTKSVLDLCQSSKLDKEIFATADWIVKYQDEIPNVAIEEATEGQIERISLLTKPQQVLAIAKRPLYGVQDINHEQPILMLDDIRDPGNLGTIIRTADWFGVSQLICSPNSVEWTNPKVIQASMGSFARVKIFYIDLYLFLSNLDQARTVWGTFLSGEPISQMKFKSHDILVIGNESTGISEDVAALVSQRVHIPGTHSDAPHAESLNASIAAAIAMYNIFANFA
jgi:TrmH family RNA methyltransferase